MAQNLYAGIDLGTGSLRMAIGHLDAEGLVVLDEKFQHIHAIGQDLQKGNTLNEATMNDVVHAFRQCAELCEKYKVAGITAVATESVRRAANGKELLARVQREAGIALQVIDGKEELRLSLLGNRQFLAEHAAVLFADSGGGSTEVALVNGETLDFATWASLPLGCHLLASGLYDDDVTSPEQFFALHADILDAFRKQLATWQYAQDGHTLVIAGAPGHLLRYLNQSSHEENREFAGQWVSRDEVETAGLEMCKIGLKGRSNHPYINVAGAYLLVPAAAKTLALMDAGGFTEARLIPSGITHGLIIDAAERHQNG